MNLSSLIARTGCSYCYPEAELAKQFELGRLGRLANYRQNYACRRGRSQVDVTYQD
jgi:hypothetical protein